MTKKYVMVVIVIVSFILYLAAMGIVIAASLNATQDQPAVVNKLWVDLIALVTPVLAMNAGAYLGLPENTLRALFKGNVAAPDSIKGWVTIGYFVVLVTAFLIAALTAYPHASLTDIGGTLAGFIVGVLSVYFGK